MSLSSSFALGCMLLGLLTCFTMHPVVRKRSWRKRSLVAFYGAFMLWYALLAAMQFKEGPLQAVSIGLAVGTAYNVALIVICCQMDSKSGGKLPRFPMRPF